MARTEIVEFKVDADEKARLKGYACDRGEPLGTYVRKAALSFPEYGKTPIAYETQHDRENKAKIREAVENEESYEVKVEPRSTKTSSVGRLARDAAIQKEEWINSTARILMMEKGLSKVAARMRASKEWDAR